MKTNLEINALIIKKKIRNQIDSFNPGISHYRREHAPNRRYLPSDISIKMMAGDFSQNLPNSQSSFNEYRGEISKKMNVSFAT